MKFWICDPMMWQNFRLVYDRYSFSHEPSPDFGCTSVEIDCLQLRIDEDGVVGYVYGYCPLIVYQETQLFPEGYKKGSLVALLEEPPTPGVSYKHDDTLWPIYINKKRGWVCLGDPKMEGRQLIEFAPQCVATMEGEDLVGLWLHPEKLPRLGKSVWKKLSEFFEPALKKISKALKILVWTVVVLVILDFIYLYFWIIRNVT